MEIFDPEKPYGLDKRIKAFVLEIFEFVEALPNNSAGKNVRNQLVRYTSSVGAILDGNRFCAFMGSSPLGD